MKPSCPLGTIRLVPQEKFSKSHIINPLLTKLVRSRWLDIGLVLFWVFMDLDSVSVHKHAKKEFCQYQAILTSHLVNNPYIVCHLRNKLASPAAMIVDRLPLVFSHCQRIYFSTLCYFVHGFSLLTCTQPPKLVFVMSLEMCGNGSRITSMDLVTSRLICCTMTSPRHVSMEDTT